MKMLRNVFVPTEYKIELLYNSCYIGSNRSKSDRIALKCYEILKHIRNMRR